jgi:hypothetical protein
MMTERQNTKEAAVTTLLRGLVFLVALIAPRRGIRETRLCDPA